MNNRFIVCLLILGLLLGLAGCGGTAPSETSPAQEAATEVTPDTEQTSTPAPETVSTPEPTPTPVPFSIGDLNQYVYRNGFLGFEVDFGALSFNSSYMGGGSDPKNRNDNTTTETALEVIRQAKEEYSDLFLTHEDMGDGAFRIILYFYETNLTDAESEAKKAEQESSASGETVLADQTVTIGDREWKGFDSLEVEEWNGSTYYIYNRFLWFVDQGIAARMECTYTMPQEDPTYEAAELLFDEFCGACLPIEDGAEPLTAAVPVFPETLVFDEKGVRCTFTGVSYDDAYMTLSFSLEYDDAQKSEIGVSNESAMTLNGMALPVLHRPEIAAEDPEYMTIRVESWELSYLELRIEEIREIGLLFTLDGSDLPPVTLMAQG